MEEARASVVKKKYRMKKKGSSLTYDRDDSMSSTRKRNAVHSDTHYINNNSNSNTVIDDEAYSDNNSDAVVVRKKRKFPSVADFMQKVVSEVPVRWSELSREQIYLVEEVHESIIADPKQVTGKRTAYIGLFSCVDWTEPKRVWLPGLAGKKLLDLMMAVDSNTKDTFIKPLGPRLSKSNRTYEDFLSSSYPRASDE